MFKDLSARSAATILLVIIFVSGYKPESWFGVLRQCVVSALLGFALIYLFFGVLL